MSLEGQARVDAKLKAFKRERRERMLERCRETAPITVEERNGKIIEWRGQRCIAPRITHMGSN